MKHFFVIGNPIKHSKSPQIHRAFAEQCNLAIQYQTLEVDTTNPSSFNETIAKLQANGTTGCNVTLPFKEKAFSIATHRSPRARFAEAANTLHFRDKTIHADNTDGIGIVNDIKKYANFTIKGTNVLIIGAGGAVRGVLSPILEEKPQSLTILNRSEDKAHKLAEICARYYGSITVHSGALNNDRHRHNHPYDLIINGASTSVSGHVPDVCSDIFSQCQLAYDMMYSESFTPFESLAIKYGAKQSCDGLGMLIEQAAESFHIWNGFRPNTLSVMQSLRGDKYKDKP